MKIGLIGAGTMGILAAELLLAAGETLVVNDNQEAALIQAAALGAETVSSPAAVAQESDIILLILPGPPQVDSVVSGAHGLLSTASPGQTIVDMSTVDPTTTRRLGARAAALGVDYLDAPILGRPSMVGKWVLPVGGDSTVLERCRSVLALLAREIVHVGDLGMGHTLKLLNALMFSAINAMSAEMMAISAKAGLDPAVLFETISGSDAATVSGLFREVGGKITRRDFSPTFPIDLLCKDNGLAVQMAKDFQAPPLLAGTIQTINELAAAQGFGREDTSALVKVYEGMFEANATRGIWQ